MTLAGVVRQVHTESMAENLGSCALALCRRCPLLLEGPPGSGKTALVEELARRTDNLDGLIWIHLDDQMDAKSLLGAYTCTAVPGEFAWQPGPLTQVRLWLSIQLLVVFQPRCQALSFACMY